MSDRMLGVMPSRAELRRGQANTLSSAARQAESLPARKHQSPDGGPDHSWIGGIVWPGARRSGWPPLTGRQSFGHALLAAWRRYRSRQRIAGLDARALRDIGVTYAEAENEANKPFWRR